MIRCIEKDAQKEIIIRNPEWEIEDNLKRLRTKGQAQALLCHECNQPVIVKAGEERVWHFAHKIAGSCPLQSESLAVINARGLLYKWLCSKFIKNEIELSGRPMVTVEKKIDGIPRPVDCFIEQPDGRKIVYWIIEKKVKDRNDFTACFSGMSLNVVFLSRMMKQVKEEAGPENSVLFRLSTDERYFQSVSKYAVIYERKHWADSKCLYYLNTETSEVTTLRGFRLHHKPQIYSANVVLRHPLSEMLTNKTGEFIHPEEHEKLQAHEKAIKERRLKEPYWAGPRIGLADSSVRPEMPRSLPPSQKPEDTPLIITKPLSAEEQELVDRNRRRSMGLESLTCRTCGKKTTNWTECALSDGTCLCRDCNGKTGDAG